MGQAYERPALFWLNTGLMVVAVCRALHHSSLIGASELEVPRHSRRQYVGHTYIRFLDLGEGYSLPPTYVVWWLRIVHCLFVGASRLLGFGRHACICAKQSEALLLARGALLVLAQQQDRFWSWWVRI